MHAPYLEQDQQGDWLLHARAAPEPIPVPNWLVELCPDHYLLIRALGKIYGHGRRIGRSEGRAEKLNEIKEILEL